MKPLEEIASSMFERFAVIETGQQADWNYLSHERKKAWISDVITIATYVLEELQGVVKPTDIPPKVATSYQMGYTHGQSVERTQFITVLQQCKEQLEAEFNEFSEGD